MSRGSGSLCSGLKREPEVESIARISIISSSRIGRTEKHSPRKTFNASISYSSSILESICSYVSSRVLGRVFSVFRSASNLRHFRRLANWHSAHRNLLQIFQYLGVFCTRKLLTFPLRHLSKHLQSLYELRQATFSILDHLKACPKYELECQRRRLHFECIAEMSPKAQ